MKKALSLLIFFISLKGYSCTFKELLDFQASGLAEGIALKDCTKNGGLGKKERICKCAKKNLGKLNFTPDQKNVLKAVHEMSIEKAKLGLLNLSEEIFMLHNMNLGEIKLDKKCDAKLRLDDKNSKAKKCPNSENLVLSASERNKRLTELWNKVVNETKFDGARVNPPRSTAEEGSHLVKRYTYNKNTKNSCDAEENPFTEKLAQDINAKRLSARFSMLASVEEANNYKTFKELLIDMQYRSKNKDVKNDLEVIKNEMFSNPFFVHLLDSPGFYSEVRQGKGKLDQVLESYKEKESLSKAIKSKIEEKCDAVFESIEKAFCAEIDDVKIPDLNPKQVKDIAKGELLETYDKTNVAHLMSVSHNLNGYYCKETDKKSNYDEVSETVAPSLPEVLKPITDFNTGASNLYNSTTINMADKICKYLPPTMDKINKVVADCKEKEKDSLQSQECILYEATQTALGETYKAKAIQVKNETIAKANKQGITDKAQIDKLVQSAIKNIDTNAIMEAYSDFSNVGKKNSDLINSFLGVVEPKTTAPTIAEKKDVIPPGASTKLTPAELAIGGFSVNSSDSDLKATSYSELAQKSQEKEINNFYDEVARRVKGFRQRQASSPISTSVGSTIQKPIPKELQRALKSPFPEPAPVKDNEEDEFYELASNYGLDSDFDYSPGNTTNNNFFENSDVSRTPVVADKPAQTEGEKMQEAYNKALANAYQTKQDEAKKAAERASGKIPDSPFKNRELGAAGGTQFRAPASLGGGGGLSFSPEYLPLNPETLEQDFQALIENVAAEKQKGIEGENTEHAKMILKMLSTENGKTVTLKSTLNPEHQIQILKRKNGKLEVKGDINGADPAFVDFAEAVDKVIIGYNDNSYKSQFSKILSDLEYAMKEGRVKPVLSGEETRVTDFK